MPRTYIKSKRTSERRILREGLAQEKVSIGRGQDLWKTGREGRRGMDERRRKKEKKDLKHTARQERRERQMTSNKKITSVVEPEPEPQGAETFGWSRSHNKVSALTPAPGQRQEPHDFFLY